MICLYFNAIQNQSNLTVQINGQCAGRDRAEEAAAASLIVFTFLSAKYGEKTSRAYGRPHS
jgi:hypothetical protein